LGRPEAVAAVSKRKDRLPLYVPGRIAELGFALISSIPSENTTSPEAEPTNQSAALKVGPLDVVSLVRGLGNPEIVTSAAKLSNHGLASQHLDIPDIIAGLGGVYLPTFRASVIDKISEVDIQALFDKTTANEDNANSIATVTSYRNTWALSSLPDMDVDEIVSSVETSRSRASSIANTVSETSTHSRQRIVNSIIHSHNNDGISISRLICALNIAPIFVRRPLLGPSRVVVFPHFY
ncbi:hypothetical protein GGI23_002049, partial [Coemansia sp. RSA 2559]